MWNTFLTLVIKKLWKLWKIVEYVDIIKFILWIKLWIFCGLLFLGKIYLFFSQFNVE